MKITLCGSIAFMDKMLEAQRALERLGHEVRLPPLEVPDENGKMIPVMEYYKIRKAATTDTGWIWDLKETAMKHHFDKVAWADAILVVNETKHEIPNYIGANVLMEIGLALHLGKKIYLLNPVPELAYKEEILGAKPVVVHGDLTRIT